MELFILVSLFLRTKSIKLLAMLRSYIKPSFIKNFILFSLRFFSWTISVVKFFIENSSVRIINALDTFPENP